MSNQYNITTTLTSCHLSLRDHTFFMKCLKIALGFESFPISLHTKKGLTPFLNRQAHQTTERTGRGLEGKRKQEQA